MRGVTLTAEGGDKAFFPLEIGAEWDAGKARAAAYRRNLNLWRQVEFFHPFWLFQNSIDNLLKGMLELSLIVIQRMH